MDKKQIELIKYSSFLDFDDQLKLQNEYLKNQGKIWVRNDNYFKSNLNNIGVFHPDDFDINMLHFIPTISKNIIAEHYHQIINSRIKVADFCTTSGSTGNYITVPLSKADINRLALNEAISFTNINLNPNDI